MSISNKSLAQYKSQLQQWRDSKYFLPVLFSLTGVLTLAFYYWGRGHMMFDKPWLKVITSNITLNFVLFLLIFGTIWDKYAKRKGKTKLQQQAIFWGGTIGLFIILRLIGFKTIFG